MGVQVAFVPFGHVVLLPDVGVVDCGSRRTAIL